MLVSDNSSAEHLYRIAQEAESNAIKHGHAKNILIRLDASGTGKLLRIIDDGSGLPPSPMSGKGMGLRIMSYRAQLVGAKFSVRRREAGGTIVTCLLPLEREASAEREVSA